MTSALVVTCWPAYGRVERRGREQHRADERELVGILQGADHGGSRRQRLVHGPSGQPGGPRPGRSAGHRSQTAALKPTTAGHDGRETALRRRPPGW
jgi:hypothetical protein